jgi:aldose 1-epimerase
VELNLPGGNKAASQETIALSGLQLLELENKHGVKMTVSPVGAAVVSLYTPDREGKMADIVLGYDDSEQYLNDEYYMGTVVGRYANRIAGHKVIIDNREYELRSKQPGYHHHGGVTGFNTKIFKARTFKGNGVSGVLFTYTSPDQEEGYPGEFQLEVKYSLTDDNEWIVEYKGISDQTTIVNLTQHAYFNLAGHASGNIDQHELQIFARHYLPVNQLQVPTGVLAPVAGTVFDFTQSKQIGAEQHYPDEQLYLSSGYDHSFVLEANHSTTLKHAAGVYEPVSGRTLQVWTTEPAVHFYAGNFLENVKGKQGAVYRQRGGLCLETQHFPDSPNHPAFPSTVLKAGEEFYSKTVFKFS